MSLKYGNKEFNNLQEQVLKNMNDISFILEQEGVLNEFGIKVVGQVEAVIDMPSVSEYKEDNPDWGYGDTFAVGTEAPYTLYVLTRANGTHPNDYWFNIGQFPVQGPKGDKGDKGDAGTAATVTVGAVSTNTLSPDQSADAHVVEGGTDTNRVLGFIFNIPRGAQGIQGAKGDKGDTGAQGPKGDQGEKGDPGNLYTILGQVASTSDLPNPSDVTRTGAYLVGASEPYDVYVIVGTGSSLEWINLGPIATTSMPTHILTMDWATSGTASQMTLQEIANESGAHFVEVGNYVFAYSHYSGGANHYYSLGATGTEVQSAELVLSMTSGVWAIISYDLAQANGEYLRMKVGLADNLTTSIDNNESAAFTFRTSGGDADIGTGASTINYLYGNSVAFNQLVHNGNFANGTTNWYATSSNGSLSASNNILTYTLSTIGDYNYSNSVSQYAGLEFIANHKYIILAEVKSTKSFSFNVGLTRSTLISHTNFSLQTTTNWQIAYQIGTVNEITNPTIYSHEVQIYVDMRNAQVGDTYQVRNVRAFDLTLMFGAGKEPTSALEFLRIFPEPYYEYNAGTLMSCQSSAYTTTGYNAFDGELEQGYINSQTGEYVNSSTAIRFVNLIRVVGGQRYTLEADNFTFTSYRLYQYDKDQNFIGTLYSSSLIFQLSPQTCYVSYTTTQTGTIPLNPRISFHLTWSGSKTGYEEYTSFIYNLPNIELRSAGIVFDELRPNGTLFRRIGVVDLGTLNWAKTTVGSSTHYSFYTTGLSGLFAYHGDRKDYFICSRYTNDLPGEMNDSLIEGIAMWGAGQVRIFDTTKESLTGDQFKSAMSGVYLYYELATAIASNVGSTFPANTYINDYGTQEFISDQTIQIPQGLSMMYNLGLRDFLQRLYLRTDGDAPSVAIGPDIPEPPTSGTYVLKSVDGVISWVSE